MRAWENTKSQGCIETEQLSSEGDPELEIQCMLWWLTKSHSLFRNSSLSQHHIVLLVGVYTQGESCFWAEAWDYSCLDIHFVLILEIFYFYFCVCVWFCVSVYRSPWEPELWHWIPWNVEVGAWKVWNIVSPGTYILQLGPTPYGLQRLSKQRHLSGSEHSNHDIGNTADAIRCFW